MDDVFKDTQNVQNIEKMVRGYIDLGWSLIPIKPEDKIPAIMWKDYQDRRANWDEVKSWLDKGWYLAVVTGEISGIAVVDDDRVKHGLPEWGFDSEIISRTQNNGKHYYFKYDREIHSTSNAALRVDLKAWHSYVLLPPFNGREWIKEPFGAINKLIPLPKETESLIKPIQNDDYRRAFSISSVVGTGDGGRNDILYKAAMSLYNKETDDRVVLSILHGLNQTFSPPLTLAEFDNQVSRAKQQVANHPNVIVKLGEGLDKKETDENGKLIKQEATHPTDMGNAYKIAEMFSDKIRFDHRRGRWLVWKKHRWVDDNDKTIKLYAMEMAKQRMREAIELEDKNEKKMALKFAISCEGKNKIDAALDLLKSIKPISDRGDEWDLNNMLLVCENGVVDLTTGELRNGKPEDRATMTTGIEYDSSATCPRFEKFIDEIFLGDKEIERYVQKALGYSITGETKEQVAFFCFGTGSNGKSVLFKTISHALGDYAYDAPPTLFQRNMMNTSSNDVAATEFKRFLVSSETLSTAKLNEQRLKKWTGGDRETARYLYGEFFSFDPTVKPWLFINHKPRVEDDSHGFWRRIRFIPFDRVFSISEQDPGLVGKLKEEAPGILNWLIRGCLLWQAEGLRDTPNKVVVATQNYQSDNDVLADFMFSCCEIGEGSTKAMVLYKAYVEWAEKEGMQKQDILNNNAFGRRMGDKFTVVHQKDGRYYRTVSLINKKENQQSFGDGLVTHSARGGDAFDPVFSKPLSREESAKTLLKMGGECVTPDGEKSKMRHHPSDEVEQTTSLDGEITENEINEIFR